MNEAYGRIVYQRTLVLYSTSTTKIDYLMM